MILCGRDVSETKTLKTPNLVKLSMTVIVRAFTDVISCDPHNNPVRYGGQELPLRRNLNSLSKIRIEELCLLNQ